MSVSHGEMLSRLVAVRRMAVEAAAARYAGSFARSDEAAVRCWEDADAALDVLVQLITGDEGEAILGALQRDLESAADGEVIE